MSTIAGMFPPSNALGSVRRAVMARRPKPWRQDVVARRQARSPGCQANKDALGNREGGSHVSVMILTLSDPAGCGDACGDEQKPRVPVLACADALREAGAEVQLVTACSDAEIDVAVKAVEAGTTRLIVAASMDAGRRGVVRRLVRRYAPPPSKRPAHLPPDRTVFDLPPLAVLPLTPAAPDLAGLLGLPQD